MKNIKTMTLIIEAIKAEKKRIAHEMLEFKKTASQFATSEECQAYNQALSDFADKLYDEIEG